MGGNKLIIVPMDSYYITHSMKSGLREVHTISERKKRMACLGF